MDPLEPFKQLFEIFKPLLWFMAILLFFSIGGTYMPSIFVPLLLITIILLFIFNFGRIKKFFKGFSNRLVARQVRPEDALAEDMKRFLSEYPDPSEEHAYQMMQVLESKYDWHLVHYVIYNSGNNALLKELGRRLELKKKIEREVNAGREVAERWEIKMQEKMQERARERERKQEEVRQHTKEIMLQRKAIEQANLVRRRKALQNPSLCEHQWECHSHSGEHHSRVWWKCIWCDTERDDISEEEKKRYNDEWHYHMSFPQSF